MSSLESLVMWRKDFLEQAEPEDGLGFPFILIGMRTLCMCVCVCVCVCARAVLHIADFLFGLVDSN